jgi:UDP-N-acetyl-D-glucosamine dehydrogenase
MSLAPLNDFEHDDMLGQTQTNVRLLPAPEIAQVSSVAIIGLGYVGLPFAMEASRSGLTTIGFDVNERAVAALASGHSHVDDINDDTLQNALDEHFSVTTDPSLLGWVDVVVICVPTPLDEQQAPDLSYVFAAAESVAANLRKGMLVVLESTTYPGTTDGPLREILETSGLVAGEDFSLAFSPERIDPGNPTFGFRNTPKVVGGLTSTCTAKAAAFYRQIVDEVVCTKGPREAEMAKLLENTYRHVNIAMINELAVFSHELGVDLWDSIDAASTKPFGFTAFYPGPGVGGHCIPIDPNYLSSQIRRLGYQFRFVELAQEVSSRMPAFVVTRVMEVLNDSAISMNGARVLLLGATYKPNIGDDRETPARPVVRGLRRLHADVVVHDPHLASFVVDDEPTVMAQNLEEAVAAADIVVLLQAHSAYDLDDIQRRAALVFDTRGKMHGDNVTRL